MTTKVQKRIERNYLDEAIRSLGVGWRILEECDPPDFIITDGDHKFGLDVAEIFHGPRTASGSQMKKTESDMQKQLNTLRCEYERRAGVILKVQFVGRIAPDTLDKVLPELLWRDLAAQPLAHQTTIEIQSGFEAPLKLYATKSNRPEWLAVGHRVGFVTRNPDPFIADEIARKGSKLARYKSLAGTDDIRLLLVADRIKNSGKMGHTTGGEFDFCGFKAVYFLPFPESALVLREAT